MSRRTLYVMALLLLCGGAGAALYGGVVFYELIASIKANLPLIEIDASAGAFIPVGIGVASVGVMFFRLLAIDDMADARRGPIMARHTIFTAVCLILYPVMTYGLFAVCAAILEPKGYVSKEIFVGSSPGSLYKVTQWQRLKPAK